MIFLPQGILRDERFLVWIGSKSGLVSPRALPHSWRNGFTPDGLLPLLLHLVMEPLPKLREARPSSPWLTLFHPMLLVSLLLHGAFMMMPVASTTPVVEEEVVEEEMEEPEEEAIALSALQATPKPTPKASPKPIPTPSPTFTPIQRVNPNPTPVPEVVVSPSPEPTPEAEASPEAEAEPEEEVTDVAATGEEAGGEEESTEVVDEDVAASRTALVDSLGTMEGVLTYGPPPSYFEPLNAYFTADPRDTKDSTYWVDGLIGIDWYNAGTPETVRPDAVVSRLQSQFEAGGAIMQELPDGYANTRLFEVSKDGQPLLYLNIVPAPGRSSTVVVQWNRNPNLPPETTAGS